MQEHGELVWLQACVAIYVLEPLRTVTRFADDPEEVGLALRLIGLKRGFERAATLQLISEDDHVLDGERSPQPDRKMGRVRCPRPAQYYRRASADC